MFILVSENPVLPFFPDLLQFCHSQVSFFEVLQTVRKRRIEIKRDRKEVLRICREEDRDRGRLERGFQGSLCFFLWSAL